MKYRYLLFLFLLGWGAKWANAHMLIVSFSDMHSAYNNLPRQILKLAKLRSEFLAKHPKAKVVLLIPGDFAGESAFARDYGQLGYDALAQLSKIYEVVLVPGNHEGFDWMGQEGNGLFLRQNRGLIRDISRIQGKEFRVNVANLTATKSAADIFRPYQDIPLENGTMVRFVGLVLQNYFAVTDHDPNASNAVFESLSPPLRTAMAQLDLAKEHGVKNVVFACHDPFKSVLEMRKKLADYKPGVQIPVSFAAHDHRIHKSLDFAVFDGGSHGEGVFVELDNTGTMATWGLLSKEEEDHNSSIEEPSYLLQDERLTLRKVRAFVAEMNTHLNEEVGMAGSDFPDHKLMFKERRTPLGTLVADSQRVWARHLFESDEVTPLPYAERDVLAFWNSSSFKYQNGFRRGDLLLRKHFHSIYPFGGTPKLGWFRGQDIQKMHASLRKYMETNYGTYTPQMGSNMRIVFDSSERLEIKHRAEGWSTVKYRKYYPLVLDPWLGRNGYKIPEWDEAFRNAHWAAIDPRHSQTAVLFNHLPPLMATEGCENLMEEIHRTR